MTRNKYKTPEGKTSKQTYLSWNNPRVTGEYDSKKEESIEDEQDHFDAIQFLRRTGWNLTRAVGDFALALERYERTGEEEHILSFAHSIIGGDEETQEATDKMVLVCRKEGCDREFSLENYDSVGSLKKARSAHENKGHREDNE